MIVSRLDHAPLDDRPDACSYCTQLTDTFCKPTAVNYLARELETDIEMPDVSRRFSDSDNKSKRVVDVKIAELHH